ncbi:MAG TPA: sugar phosphate isomerase/epimerase family protein [Pirellulaceae bacterium]|nr:sugar phosphate isomerase/epimerase family protein [Pirellulaceae bacterium]
MRPCLFSVSYAGFWGQAALPLAEFIARAGKLGFVSVMIAGKRPHLSPLDAGPRQLEEVQAALAAAGVTCDVIAGYTNLAPGSASEVPDSELQIAYVESLARIAARLGARAVRIFTAYELDGSDPAAVWRRAVAIIREMCDRAAVHGVAIAVQNHHDLAIETDALLELVAEIGRTNCKLGFDAWSLALRGEDLYSAAKKAAPHTIITTNADYVRVPRYRYRPELVNYERLAPDLVRAVPFGCGIVDYEAFFHGLRDGGFNGIATYEICSPIRGGGSLENLDACGGQYLEWMRQRGLLDS